MPTDPVTTASANPRLGGGVVASLQDLFAGWRINYGHAGATFCADGLIGEDERAWLRAEPRILFLSKETNDRDGVMAASGYDLCRLLRDSHEFRQNVKTFERTLAAWSLGLQSRRAGRRLSYDQANENAESAAAAFRASAVMNLKKQPGRAQCKVRELISAAERDRFWIEREIEILSPTVVVCCGTFRVVARVLGGFDSVGGAARCHLRNGMLWVDHWHPCALRGAAAKYDRLMDACEAFMGRETAE